MANDLKAENASVAMLAECHVASARARMLLGFHELVRERSGDPQALLDAAGIDARLAADPSARLPLAAIGRVLQLAAERLDCPDFGMRLADRQPLATVMEPLGTFYRCAPTIRESLLGTVRHMSAFSSGLTMSLSDRPDARTCVDYQTVDGFAAYPQLMEQLLFLTHRSILALSSGFARTRRVSFMHRAQASPAVYARRFNAVVEFRAARDALFLDRSDLELRAVDCDARRFAHEARRAQALFPTAPADLVQRLRRIMRDLLEGQAPCTRSAVARRVGLEERTLNRRLAQIGTCFETVRDQLRRDLAYRYLARSDMTLTEIAGRLGYAELAVLSRCCQRWFGASPRSFRQTLRTIPEREPAAPIAA